MKLVFTDRAWQQYLYWQENDRKILLRLNELIKECQRTPTTGTGKPERLRESLTGFWSRRLTQEHRLVYRVTSDSIEIVQCRYHY